MKTFIEFHNLRESFDSFSLFQEVISQSSATLSKIKSVFDFITENKLNVVLIGGMAVAHYIKRTITPDVDFMVSNIDTIKQVLNNGEITYTPLAGSGFGGIHVPIFDTDFIDAQSGNVFLNNYVIKTAIPVMIGGINVPIINKNVLVIQKFQIGRNKDIEDAFNLLKIIDKKEFKSHLKILSRHIEDAESILGYTKTIKS